MSVSVHWASIATSIDSHLGPLRRAKDIEWVQAGGPAKVIDVLKTFPGACGQTRTILTTSEKSITR